MSGFSIYFLVIVVCAAVGVGLIQLTGNESWHFRSGVVMLSGGICIMWLGVRKFKKRTNQPC